MEDSLEVFIEKIKEQLEDIDTGGLSAETDFRQLEWWSSMNALIIIAHINTEYEKHFTGADLKNCTTLTDLYNVVLKNNR